MHDTYYATIDLCRQRPIADATYLTRNPNAIRAYSDALKMQSRGYSLHSKVDLLNQIDAMGKLGPDWDGYGALSISSQTVANARNLLGMVFPLVPSPELTPNPNGTISFEWEGRQGTAHLEVGKTKFSFFAKPVAGGASYADGPVSQFDPMIGSVIGSMFSTATTTTAQTTTFIPSLHAGSLAY